MHLPEQDKKAGSWDSQNSQSYIPRRTSMPSRTLLLSLDPRRLRPIGSLRNNPTATPQENFDAEQTGTWEGSLQSTAEFWGASSSSARAMDQDALANSRPRPTAQSLMKPPETTRNHPETTQETTKTHVKPVKPAKTSRLGRHSTKHRMLAHSPTSGTSRKSWRT